MRRSTIKKILEDEETLDIAKTAEAIKAKNDLEKNAPKHVPSRRRQLQAFLKKKARDQEEERFRLALRKFWNTKIT